MEWIRLLKISKERNRISYDFEVSPGLKGYFSGKPFFVEYPDCIEAVPDGVCAVPFVSSVLPMMWICDAVLEVPALDQAFYDCIAQLKKGYEAMYPETVFAGSLQVGEIQVCTPEKPGGCAAYFSGGLDSVQTLIRHLEEKPDLISIWGSDVTVDNQEGWAIVRKPIEEYAHNYDLKAVTIRSGFRAFDLEWELDKVYEQQLRSNWWYGVKHGVALLGQSAPYAYVHGLTTIYIASSNSEDEIEIRCASDPTLDNHVRFAACRVIHDGFEFGRQAKVRNIAAYVRRTGEKLPLHVCWESQSGSNCCECEKCYRTMVGLMAEGEDPVNYGFEQGIETLGKMRKVLIGDRKIKENVAVEWLTVHQAIVRNQDNLRDKPFWKHIKWIVDADFEHPNEIRLPLAYRLRMWLVQFPLLQKIYNLRKIFTK